MFIDIDTHDRAVEAVEHINNGKRSIPMILINDTPYTNPDNATLRDVLNIDQEDVSKCCDTVIIGAGAVGLTASIYIQRDKFDSLILERKNIGGNAFSTETIENYPGFTKISVLNLWSGRRTVACAPLRRSPRPPAKGLSRVTGCGRI